MEFPRWAIPAAAALTATGLVLTACGQESAGKQQNAAAGAKAEPDTSSEPSAPAAEPTTLEVASVTKLGKVVTDGQGRTLYRFDNDTARPPASTCMDACAKAWPPVWAGAENPEVKGVQQSLVGKVKRPDGKWQVTLGGWPLYRFAKDQSPGDVKGQGVGGTWYAAAPTGKKAGALAAPPRKAAPPAGNRWKGWTVVKAKQDPKLGQILTDGKGRTLYRFDKDTPKPPNSTCFGACKKAWPPAVFNGWKRLKLEGVDKKLVNFIERKDDGECQLTVNGWPLYYYAKDDQPGDTEGQGVGGIWWASTPEGKKAKAAAGGGGDGGGDGGYGSGGYGSGGGY
ncbi:hypothetical protein [Actinomadura rubrisoli]|uniref:Lipoprotein n=1 Tax=Actinomadura rubrisoli TaxID=2530368 RepID=A0A4R5C247_9ACTN|nr:hypothetical protein [Actinomadura rubrisoli]TDD92103.1 hypothetical protein E1298_11160 [Actinomadura rubrisoli]